ncbi:MAG: RNA polymerase-associated protein RapA, partial [Aeromonas sp.]
LDPERFYDYEVFLAQEQAYGQVASAAQELLDGETLSDEARAILASQLVGLDLSDAAARQQAVTQLLDQHGTGRVLFRNSRANIQGFPERRLCIYPMPLPEQYKTAIKVMGMMGGNGGDLQSRALRYLYPEKIFQQFEGDNASWTQFDPRVEWLLDLLLSARQEKVLVICSEAATALALEEALRTREGIRGTVFHEGMSILERDKASAYFAQEEGGAQVLLCSEIGSEGRNFQFASHLVLFDLPLNPDLLEQRIGRLDRIGQQNTVQIHVPYFEETAQHALQRWYHDGLNAFEQTCPTARPVFEAVRDELFELLATNSGVQETLDALLAKTRDLHEPLKAKMEQGRDRLLEIHSSGGAAAQQLVKTLAAEDGDTAMIAFALKMFDEIGVNQDDRGENALVLTPGDHMLVSSFPGLPQDGMTITFDRNTALSRDDMALLSWDHPMMRGGIDLILGSEIGATSVALLKNKALPIGSILLELIFVAESAAHPQLYRFMPPTPIRLLMDKNGQNLGGKVAFEAFNRQLSPVNRHLGSKLVTASQPVIHGLIGKAQPIAEALKVGIVEKARALMTQTLQRDLDRLEALKVVNPNVRDSELEYLRNLQTELHHLIDQTQLKLDAIRFIVVTHN